MLKNIVSIFLILLITACASSGGGTSTEPPTPPTSGGTTTSTDKRIPFEDWELVRSIDIDGYSNEVKIVHTMTPFTTTGLPAPTDKFKIADYGFLQSTIYGQHNGCDDCGEESNTATAFVSDGMVRQADLNGDGHWDFYLWIWYGGDKEYVPETTLMAWINDGTGHFELRQDLFEGGAPCLNGGGHHLQFTSRELQGDPFRDCGWSATFRNPVVADFNGDGIDDFFAVSKLILSNNGKLVDVSHTNLPHDFFFNTDIGPIFTHEITIGDSEGDGDTDIFLPVNTYTWDHKQVPFTMLINDGTGNFSVNQNFPLIPEPHTVGLDHSNRLWATTAAVGDFDNDGFGDVSVGWFNPKLAREYGFGETYENSAGAVFFNDGTNDWRNRPWLELPNNFYGENGNANSMAVIDFNGDGFLDIVVASTKNNPYYQGRMIQFFLNNGGNSFTDVTSQYGDTTYANGGLNNPNLWNGEGYLTIVDFDNDGDLDIVDSNSETYVLLNDGNTFTLYNDFPRFADGHQYHPVEIDGEHWYDFIGWRYNDSNSHRTATFFQVLDPPFAEMQHDIVTKPLGYADSIFRSTMILNDLRNQTKGNNLFGKVVDNTNMLGYSYSNKNGYGLYVADYSGNYNGSIIGFDYEGDDNVHAGLSLSSNEFVGYNKTKWYGTGKANLKTESINMFMEYTHIFTPTLFGKIGFTIHQSKVKEFTETDSAFNVSIDEFDMTVGSLFADIGKVFKTDLGDTYISLGAEYYETREVDIVFSDYLNYTHKEDLTVGKFGFTHTYGIFYFTAELDTENREIYQLGFRFNLK
tara:strand:+ start:452 stop:2860 length:2409 start_codon:yes stop_codon:yes gene_type:complete